MKKFLLSIVAAATLVACATEDVVRAPKGNAITFGNSYLWNTRTDGNPSFTTDNLAAFDVWAFMDQNTGVVFTQERVTKDGEGVWSYVNTQYWTPSHKYYFAALAPVDHANVELTLAADPYMVEAGLGSVAFTNLDGTDDLIYAEAVRETAAELNDTPAPVKMGFDHLLSKVKFSFKNGFTNDNAYLVVENIKMVVPGKGTIDLTQDDYTWTLDELASDAVLDFGHMKGAEKVAINEVAVSDNERFTIPAAAAQEYEVTFKVTLYMGDVVAGSYDKITKISGAELVAGKAYNFRATLTSDNIAENPLYPIEFTAEVNDWDEEIIYDGGSIETTEPIGVTTADEITAAAANATDDITILLLNDIVGNATILQKADVNVTLDGAGYKYDGTIAIHGQARYQGEEQLLIKNVNFETSTASVYFIDSNSTASAERYAHNVTVKDCTFNALGNAVQSAVALRIRQGFDIRVINSTATALHSLLQGYGIAGVIVDGVNISGGKSGVSLGTSTGVVIKNSTIVSDVDYSYGVRCDANSTQDVVLANNNITAGVPVSIRKATGSIELDLAGNTYNALNGYAIVAGIGEYEDGKLPELPTGTVTIKNVASFADFKAAVESRATNVIVSGQVDADNQLVRVATGSSLVLEGANDKASYNGSMMVTGNLLVRNLIIESLDGSVAGQVSQFSKSNLSLQNAGKVTCENVTFNMGLLNDATAITAWWSTQDGANIVCKNCEFNCAGQRPIRSDACVTVESCVFNDQYRYAVQMTSKSSTMAAEALAYVNFNNNVINAGSTSSKPVYGIQLEGGTYGCSDLTINGAGNVINLGDTGKDSAMYYCECGKVDHATITWNTEVAPVHAE